MLAACLDIEMVVRWAVPTVSRMVANLDDSWVGSSVVSMAGLQVACWDAQKVALLAGLLVLMLAARSVGNLVEK